MMQKCTLERKSSSTVNIYVDESGDLGFSAGSSRTFVVACVFTGNPSFVATKVSRTLKRFNQRKKRKLYEFKYGKDGPDVRRGFLNVIEQLDIGFSVVGVRKSGVKGKFGNDMQEIYNLLVSKCLTECSLLAREKNLNITFDRRREKDAEIRFERHLSRVFQDLGNEHRAKKPSIEILSRDSHDDKCLQIADYIAGACFQHIERKNDTDFEILKGFPTTIVE